MVSVSRYSRYLSDLISACSRTRAPSRSPETGSQSAAATCSARRKIAVPATFRSILYLHIAWRARKRGECPANSGPTSRYLRPACLFASAGCVDRAWSLTRWPHVGWRKGAGVVLRARASCHLTFRIPSARSRAAENHNPHPENVDAEAWRRR